MKLTVQSDKQVQQTIHREMPGGVLDPQNLLL